MFKEVMPFGEDAIDEKLQILPRQPHCITRAHRSVYSFTEENKAMALRERIFILHVFGKVSIALSRTWIV